MKKLISVTAWWASLLFTSLAVASILVGGIVMRKLPASPLGLVYGSITILALLLNRTSASVKSEAADVLGQFRLAATPLLYFVTLIQKRVRRHLEMGRTPEVSNVESANG
jgi:hypothetical protein